MNKTKIVSIANQKGGVGKTTSALNMGTALALRGYRTLIIDLDPQGNASTGLGVSLENREYSSYDLLFSDQSLADLSQSLPIENLFILPSSNDLSSADAELGVSKSKLSQLSLSISKSDHDYDYIFIDCPPSLTLLTLNAFVASDTILVPLQAEFFALEGLSQLLMTVREVRQSANRRLRISGIFLTMYDGRNKLCRQVESDARDNLGDLVYKTKIPRNVKLSEAPSFGMSIIEYEPHSRGAIAYRNLACEFLERDHLETVLND